MKILIATDLTEDSMAILHQAEDMTIKVVPPTVQVVREELKDSHAIIVRNDIIIDGELISHAPLLKVIGHPSAGLSGVEVELATERGIIVMNAPGVSALAVGEHTMTLLLALCRRVVNAHNRMREGYWLMDRPRQAGTQISGKILGLVGMGRVGQIVAQRALSFGMTVLAYDPYLSEDHVRDKRISLIGLKELLGRSDIVSLHVPATTETLNIINAERIQQMKPGVRLINTSHGGAMDEQAVADALKSGHLAGVAVDVYREEPPANSPLIGLDRVLHTPHIGDNTIEAAADLSIQIVEQVLDALRQVDYRNAVNMPFLPNMDFETIRPYLNLMEKMGTLLHILSRHPVRRVSVEYRGEAISELVKPLTVALLKGLLSPILGDTISYINAPLLTSERGIQVTQVKGLHISDYSTQVACQVTLEDGEDIIIAGTLLDHKDPHIMQINEYAMNFVPQGHMLLMGSYDRPGVIGSVGTLMANNGINIASWHTGRAEPGGQTLTVLTLDSSIPDDVMEALEQLEFVRHIHQVQL